MEFRLLGPLEIWGLRGAVDAGPPKQRILLASLLLSPGQPLSADVLVDRLWAENPPNAARESLYAYVTRLRRVLRQATDGAVPVQLLRRPGGYLIDVDRDAVDLHRFQRLAAEARDAEGTGGGDLAKRLLREALALWRGTPLAGLPGDWATGLRAGLEQQRVAAMTQLGGVELCAGQHAAIVDDLARWVADHPLAEPLVAHLMLALYRSGRGAEALTVYERSRTDIAERLGIDPGPQLRQLHQRILRQDPDLMPAVAKPAGAESALVAQRRAPSPPTPAQLPVDIATFTGRAEQLRRLDALLPTGPDHVSTVVISAIGGTPGVGKTALAVHWAHRAAGRFPDGQLYVNLRGFDPGGAAMSPAEALRGFVGAFEVPAHRVPADLPALAALYRSLLVGRRMLVVLDNARDAEQVRPLLPGSPGCHVVVTSRNQLTGLVAAEGACPLTLDLLTAAEAREMLADRLGAARVAAEPEAVERIIEQCARLPLALAIVAARAVTYPEFPLVSMADEFGDGGGRLHALTGDDTATDVRAVFSWSYRTLRPSAGRLFRLLGLHPGPDVTGPAAAGLSCVPVPDAQALLTELTRGQLVKERAPGRYTMHDLLRAYAAELADRDDTEDDRRAAVRRLLDHYLRTAATGARLLDPHWQPIPLVSAAPGIAYEELADPAEATAWFTDRYQVLLAAVELAVDQQFDAHAWQLAWSLTTVFQRTGKWHDWASCQDRALVAARRLGDRVGQAHLQRGLGVVYGYLNRFDDAHSYLEVAAELLAELGDVVTEAQVHISRSWVYSRLGRYQEALQHSRRALELNRAGGDRRGQAIALHNIGWYSAQLGDLQQGLAYCQEALAAVQQIGDRRAEANTWDSLGYVFHHLGRHQRAIECYQRALALPTEVGHRYDQAEILTHLGDTYAAASDHGAARAAWQRALGTFDELGHPEAEKVRARLSRQA